MNTNYYEYLRKTIPRLMPSQSMCAYLQENLEFIEKWKIINLILGSPIPLTEKKEIFHTLSAFEDIEIRKQENEDDDDHWMRVRDAFSLYDQFITEALNDLQPSEAGFFLLQSHEWEAPEQHFTDSIPFCTVEEAMDYLEKVYAGEDISHTWHVLEKWVRKDGELHEVRYYAIIDNQICYFSDSTHYHYMPYCAHSADLNLPVPYKPGDFVTVDGQPFCGETIAMITGIGDNNDCCCLQAVYLDYKGNIGYGAVKHATVFQAQGDCPFPLMSPLYRIEPFHGELPEKLKPLLILRKYLTGDHHLIDDIYFTSMMRFKSINDITEEAMQEIQKECIARYQHFLEERRIAARSKKGTERPTPRRAEKLIRKHLTEEYGKTYTDLVLDEFEVETCNEKSLVLYTKHPMHCAIIQNRLLPDILHIIEETFGIYPEPRVIVVE